MRRGWFADSARQPRCAWPRRSPRWACCCGPYTGGGAGGFVALSAVALGAIGVANVVMPVVVKRYFPQRVGVMTGFYSMGLTVGASLAAATTVPITQALGGRWQTGLAFWALPAALAAVA